MCQSYKLTVNTHTYVHMKKNHGSVFLHTFSGGTKGRSMLRNKQLIDKQVNGHGR